MKNPSFQISLPVLGLLLLFQGCSNHSTQTTSGKGYLDGYTQPIGSGSGGKSKLDEEVREVAAIEPTLRFPARIGLAKVRHGKLVNLTIEEFEAWSQTKDDLGQSFGEFVPVSPLVAESVYSMKVSHYSGARDVLRKIRLGAARQHLDAVLIYESFSENSSKKLATSIANWTLVGAYIVPSREIQTVAFANALLIDVRNGYPYGTASASVRDKEPVTLAFEHNRRNSLSDRNEIKGILKLIPEVKQMFLKLKQDLGGEAG